jgi:hypothetical protein
MTIQDLKDNRDLIITTITNEMGERMVKTVMGEMVKMLGYRGINSTNVVDYVFEVINLCDIKVIEEEVYPALWGAGCKYSTQAEYQRSCMGSKWN